MLTALARAGLMSACVAVMALLVYAYYRLRDEQLADTGAPADVFRPAEGPYSERIEDRAVRDHVTAEFRAIAERLR